MGKYELWPELGAVPPNTLGTFTPHAAALAAMLPLDPPTVGARPLGAIMPATLAAEPPLEAPAPGPWPP